METSTPQIQHFEDLLITFLETKQLDLTHNGLVTVEKMTVPKDHDKEYLSYYFHMTKEGPISGQLTITQEADSISCTLEVNIKKFLRPQLGMSSAHIAVLIHYVKKQVRKLVVPPHIELLTWQLDRVQRKFKCQITGVNHLNYFLKLLYQLSQLITRGNQLSIEIIIEEAEYYRSIERWEHAKRAYATWHIISQLELNEFQDFLAILHRLKDWKGCIQLLEDGISAFDQLTGAKFAYAACVLSRDVILDLNKAIMYSEQALSLDNDNPLYLETQAALARDIDNAKKQVDVTSSHTVPQAQVNSTTLSHDSDNEGFFDDLSLEHSGEDHEKLETKDLAQEDASTNSNENSTRVEDDRDEQDSVNTSDSDEVNHTNIIEIKTAKESPKPNRNRRAGSSRAKPRQNSRKQKKVKRKRKKSKKK